MAPGRRCLTEGLNDGYFKKLGVTKDLKETATVVGQLPAITQGDAACRSRLSNAGDMDEVTGSVGVWLKQ